MVDKVDFKFISQLEGGRATTGYVPAAGVSSSGVTIATGFDLGQRNIVDIKALGLSAALVEKLKPYLDKKRLEAVTFLKQKALVITSAEAEQIDKAVKKSLLSKAKLKYFSSAHNSRKLHFDSLPAEAQTVIASVAFQCGASLDVRVPKFWQAVSSQNWGETIKILNSFGDAYPSRRRKEADLLKKLISK